jgi:hypothetical protein
VDGPNASHISALALDRWESRLEDIFAGRPYDMLDAALSDTVANFPVDIQPFRDMIEGMRMDLRKSRYRTFDELYLYCYCVASTVGLMSVPVMGISPDSRAATETVYKGALALGLANQLTNILRDVGEECVTSPLSDACNLAVISRSIYMCCTCHQQCEEGKDLSPAGRAGDGGALRSRHLQRPRHRRVERLHEGPDHEGEVVLQAGRGRRHRAQPGEPMAGETSAASYSCLAIHFFSITQLCLSQMNNNMLTCKSASAAFRCGLLCFCTGRSWTRSRRTTTTTSPRGPTSPRRRS